MDRPGRSMVSGCCLVDTLVLIVPSVLRWLLICVRTPAVPFELLLYLFVEIRGCEIGFVESVNSDTERMNKSTQKRARVLYLYDLH